MMTSKPFSKVAAILFASLLVAPVALESSATEDSDLSLGEGAQTERIKARHMLNWAAYGAGEIAADHGQIIISEADESAGIMLVSPKSYCGDVILRYDTQVLNAATVMVTNLAVSGVNGSDLSFPNGYAADVQYMFDHLSMYNLVYHASAHNRPGPFLRRFPEPGRERMAVRTGHAVETGKYHAMEAGRVGDRVWLSVDGETVVEWQDSDPHTEGHIIFRIRGTAPEHAAALIRNVEIINRPDDATCS